MANHKKVNTLDLIHQMAEKNKETVEVMKSLRNERSSELAADTKQHLELKDVRKVASANISKVTGPVEIDGQTENPYGALKSLTVFLTAETFRDKRESFTLSLSEECLGKYETLATGTSYKLGIKTSRNDLIRKVLEDFIVKKHEHLVKLIDQK